MTDLSRWPALVLTAGLATRLRPLSDVRAKAAMPVAGAPIIARILRWLAAAGVRDVVLNLHHKPESITSIVGDGVDFGMRVRYSWERQVLGSAGGPRRAMPLLDSDRFLIINGDTLTNCDLGELVTMHVANRARVTMAVVDGDVQRYGGVIVDEEDRVRGFGRPPDGARAYHFIGVQAVDAEIFAPLPEDEPSETVRGLYPRMAAQDRSAIRIYHSHAEFLDVGTARDYLETVKTVAARERKAIDIGVNCAIPPDAVIQNSVLWDRVVVGRGARIIDSVIADDVVIPPNSIVDNQVVTTHATGKVF